MLELNKEFWDDLSFKYPEQMSIFKIWIDKYKERVNWKELFNETIRPDFHVSAPKYHDLPAAMQVGIFMEFSSEVSGYQLIPPYSVLNWRYTITSIIENLQVII